VADSTKVVVTWRDKFLRITKVVLYVASTVVDPNNTIITGLIALMKAINEAYPTEASTGIAETFTGTFGTGGYSTCEDKAQMALVSSEGLSSNYKIPAPVVGIFESDTYTVDPANTLVTAWITAMSTYAVGQSAVDTLTSTFQGKRLRHKNLKH